MTRRFTSGGEFADLIVFDGTSVATNYALTNQTSTVRSGTRSIRCVRTVASTGGCYAYTNYTGLALSSDEGTPVVHRLFIEDDKVGQSVWARAYFNAAVLTGTGTAILDIISFWTSSARVTALFMGISGLLRVSGAASSDLSTPTTGVWYRLLLRMTQTTVGGAGAVQAWIFEENTNTVIATAIQTVSDCRNIAQVRFGMQVTGFAGSGLCDWFLEDFAVNDEQGRINNGNPGHGGVVSTAVPIAPDGSPLQLTPSAGTDHWALVDEYMTFPGSDTSDYLEVPSGAGTPLDHLSHTQHLGIGDVTAVSILTHSDVVPGGSGGTAHTHGLYANGQHFRSYVTGAAGYNLRSIGGYDVDGLERMVKPWTNKIYNDSKIVIGRISDLSSERKRFYSTAMEIETNKGIVLPDPLIPGSDRIPALRISGQRR